MILDINTCNNIVKNVVKMSSYFRLAFVAQQLHALHNLFHSLPILGIHKPHLALQRKTKYFVLTVQREPVKLFFRNTCTISVFKKIFQGLWSFGPVQ